MIKRNNKRLYESIMRDVAKIVKKHLNESVNPLSELFDEYETDILNVSDFDLVYNGTRIDTVVNNGDDISFWAGDPDEDEYAEEILLDDLTREEFINQILEYM